MRTPITRSAWIRPLLLLTGATASNSCVDVAGDVVRVRLGFGFSASFPKAAVLRAARWEEKAPRSIGVHGWRGRWLVNGARGPLVTIDLDPAQRARVLGVPVTLRQLIVSVDAPDTLVAELVRNRRPHQAEP